ncbi:MAG: hypothetical protein ACR2JC_13095 [Chloroflexota bacterium]
MKRSTMSMPGELEQALNAYVGDHEAPPAVTSVVEAALRQFLAERGYLRPSRPFSIHPAERGSGMRDISIEPDRYLAGH